MPHRQDIVSSLILVPIRSGLRGFCLFILEIFSVEYQQKNPLKYYALPFLSKFVNKVHFRLVGFVKAKRYRKINFFTTSALSFIAIVLMINVILPNIILSQEEHDSEGWIQGHVTYVGKDSISVEGIRYQFDPLLIIRDPEGNILEPVALKNAEIVKVLDKNGRAMKIVIIQLRK